MDTPALTDATLAIDGGVATLTFERHDVRNALTGTGLIDDIVAVAQWVNAGEAISVLVLTGAGSAFSAGGNVKDMAERGGDFAGEVAECADRYRRGIQRIPLALQEVEVPVIAAVNGPAIGAGCDLANMADIRIASTRAKFGETFLNLGIIPGDGGAWLMQRLIGYQRAFELTLSGRIIDAAEALQYGIAMEVVEPDRLLPRAHELAARFAAQPPKALRLTKRLMKMAQRMELKDFLDLCAVFQGMCHNEAEHLDAVRRFLDK
ncbi:MAG: enoyl-CoA hydratase/isomerase family protein [Rhodocyclaceae bacterium]|nr:enoyl-CoA hydratase/isomerase family protein [Rhodocyclaceae bacterium]